MDVQAVKNSVEGRIHVKTRFREHWCHTGTVSPFLVTELLHQVSAGGR